MNVHPNVLFVYPNKDFIKPTTHSALGHKLNKKSEGRERKGNNRSFFSAISWLLFLRSKFV